jgi:hypothetical protein
MSRDKDNRDLGVLIAMSGTGDSGCISAEIVDDYLLREKMENAREQGFSVPEDFIPDERTEVEKELWKAAKSMEELDAKRVNKVMDDYPKDEDDVGIYIEKSRTLEII